MRETYGDLREYVETRTGVSKHRIWNVLKVYKEVVQEAVKRGNSVDIQGLVDIYYTMEGYVYDNRVYGFDEQVKDVSERLALDELEVRGIIYTYLKRVMERLHDGYRVNLIGICYMEPVEDSDGVVRCDTRVSAVLQKPEVVDYLFVTDRGIVLKEVEDKDLRYRIEPKEDIEFLYRVATEREEKLKLKKVNI